MQQDTVGGCEAHIQEPTCSIFLQPCRWSGVGFSSTRELLLDPKYAISICTKNILLNQDS